LSTKNPLKNPLKTGIYGIFLTKLERCRICNGFKDIQSFGLLLPVGAFAACSPNLGG
jgi:hypothetical protein